ncbi:hypothetical protein ACWEKM_24565 [Streptomyces sp. NPDC004752]
MSPRAGVYGMLIPTIIGASTLAAIVLPRGSNELTWPRFITGCASFVTIQLIGGYIGGRLAGRRSH